MTKEIGGLDELHEVLDHMISLHPKRPVEIAICESLAKFDNGIKDGYYKGIPATVYREWYANGKILIQ